jgi:cellulose synthase/poly-beta-1,6-N-acetylglucosamine synthase-like glycosyltransferase
MKKILIGSPVKQKPSILSEFLSFLKKLDSTGTQLDFFFYNDNDNKESKSLLYKFEHHGSGKIVKDADDTVLSYECDEFTHQWEPGHFNRVIRFKDAIIHYAKKEGYDFLFLVDSDICVHPDTLRQLLIADKDIISEVFWTRWNPNEIYQPQVWNFDFYNYCIPSANETQKDIVHNTFREILKFQKPGVYKVGGLGALTLISKKALDSGVSFSFLYNLSWAGEDRHFCLRAAALGLELYADTNCPAYHIYRESELKNLDLYNKYLLAFPDKLFLPPKRIVRKEPRLTLAMLLRNEEGRYLEKSISSVLTHVNNAVILDDASTDNTEKICRDMFKDIPLLYHRNEIPGFNNEINLRKQLWDFTISTDPDWILCLDADEIMDDNIGGELRDIFNCYTADVVGFRLYDMWNESWYRSDNLWNAHNRFFQLMVRYQPFFEYKWQETSLHCGRFPFNILEQTTIYSHVRVKHFGWAKEEDRRKKFERYMELDPDGKFGIMAQYQSILDDNPNLEDFEVSTPKIPSILSITDLKNNINVSLSAITFRES